MDNIDLDFLSFLSKYPIDKIIATGTASYLNSGVTSDYAAAKIQNDTIVNPVGRLCFARFVWSIDLASYSSADAHLFYSYTISITPPGVTSSPARGLKAAAAMGISATTITFQTANGDHGNVASIDGGATFPYTPVAHTFNFKYALFEIS